MDLERAQFLLRQAFDEDEGENKDEASELYMQAVEMFIKIVSNKWKFPELVKKHLGPTYSQWI